jgi:DNA-binding beta-propeller fold protein YncE
MTIKNHKLKTKNVLLVGCFVLTLVFSCRKDDVVTRAETVDLQEGDTLSVVTGFFLLNEGNMGSNKASLDYFSYAGGQYRRNIYAEKNPTVVKELGDVGNDLKIYGDKLYAVINCSNKVEVMSVSDTARRIAKIDVPNCRYISFHQGKAYVSSYVSPVQINPDAERGSVVEIDTASLQILRTVQVGYQPEEMAVANGKLYVANSGGYLFPNYDNTISVIDLNTFTVTGTIAVAINLHRIKADAYGDLYVSSRGDNSSVPSNLYVIDTKTDLVKKAMNIPASNLAICGDSLYVTGGWNRNTPNADISYAIVNVRTEELISRAFITDGTDQYITIPYGIAVNPQTREIFVTDAKDYVTPGTLYCFTPDGKKKWNVTTGDIPAHIVFTGKR